MNFGHSVVHRADLMSILTAGAQVAQAALDAITAAHNHAITASLDVVAATHVGVLVVGVVAVQRIPWQSLALRIVRACVVIFAMGQTHSGGLLAGHVDQHQRAHRLHRS